MTYMTKDQNERAKINIIRMAMSPNGNVLQEYEKQGVKVICFESYPEIIELMKENVITATLDSEIEEQGKQAVEVLMDYLVYGKKPERKHLHSEIRILLKESL